MIRGTRITGFRGTLIVWVPILIGFVVLRGKTSTNVAPSQTSTKPNIVFILVDNLGYGELGVYGGGILRGAPTPRIDKLASEGTHAEIASQLSEALGKQITFTDIPEAAMRNALAGLRVPQWQADGLVEDYAHYRRGEAAAVSTAVRDVTGVPPPHPKTTTTSSPARK